MKNKRMTLKQKRAIVGLLFILPWLIGFIIYYVSSLILTTQFSFSNVDIADVGGYTSTYAGLENFKYILFQHAFFNQVLVNSLNNIVIDVPFIIFFSLFIAMMLNAKFKGRAAIRAIFFIPILLSSGAVLQALDLATRSLQGGAAASVAENSASAGVNMDYFIRLFMDLGLPERMMNYVVSLVGRIFYIVRASSIQIIIFIAALQSVPASLYEVSKIEGATSYETFWKITFPMVSPLILTNVVYTIIDAFANSDVVDIAYAEFQNYNYGYSSAMSILSTLIMSIILLVICGIINKFTFYYN